MEKNRTTTRSRRPVPMMFVWGLILCLILIQVVVFFIFSFSMTAAFIAALVLVTWLMYSLGRRSIRERNAFFEGSPIKRYGGCGVLIAIGTVFVVQSLEAIHSGSICLFIPGKYSRHSSEITIVRANFPEGFWMAVCAVCYVGLLFYYMVIVELIIMNRKRRHAEREIVRQH